MRVVVEAVGAWAYRAGGKGICRRENVSQSLEHQKALNPENWASHTSHGKGSPSR